MERTREIKKVLVITLFLNAIVSGIKIILGYSINSVAVLSDGFHSLYDGLSNVVGYIAVSLSSTPPDEKHPYGHRKFETLFTMGIGVLVLLTCVEIFRKSLRAFLENKNPEITSFGFVLMFLTLLINIFVNRYEVSKAKKLSSEYLMADAGHTASDIFITIGTIASLLLCKIGLYRADGIAGFIVGFLVAIVGYKILRHSADILVDSVQMDKEKIYRLVTGIEGVTGCHNIRTRGTKECVFLDLHVEVEKALSLQDAHDIADRIEEMVKKEIPSIKDVIVHVEPTESRTKQ